MEWTTKGCDDKTRTSTFLSADQGYLSSDKNDSGLPSNSLESVTQCLESVNIITPASETRTVHNKAGCLDSKDFDDEDYFSLEEQEQKMQLKRDYLLNKALKQDDDGDSDLHLAIVQQHHGAADGILQLIGKQRELLDLRNRLLQAPLHLAALTNQPQIVRALVLRGATIDIRDRNGNTPLFLAVREGHITCVRALTHPLLSHEVALPFCAVTRLPEQNPQLRNYFGQTVVHVAAAAQNWEVLSYLTSAPFSADVNATDALSGRTVLHHAVEAHRLHFVKQLLQHSDLDLKAETLSGRTALCIARGLSDIEMVSVLNDALYERYSGLPFSVSDTDDDEEMDEDNVESEIPSYDDYEINGQPVQFILRT